jgi:hypothetical protein
MYLNLHGLLEAPCSHPEPGVAGLFHALLEQFLGKVGWSRTGEAGPAPSTGTGKQGELTDEEQFSFNIQSGEIELTIFISEDTQTDYFLHQVFDILPGIPVSHPDKDYQPPPNAADYLATNTHRGMANPLQQRFHPSGPFALSPAGDFSLPASDSPPPLPPDPLLPSPPLFPRLSVT